MSLKLLTTAIIIVSSIFYHESEAGFVEGASCNDRNTAYLNPSKSFFPSDRVKCVDLTGMGKSLIFYKEWPILQADTLYADHMHLTFINRTMFKFMPNLELIDFTDNNIRRIPVAVSNIIPKLTTLLLTKNRIQIPKKRPLMRSFTIKTLMLSQNKIKALQTMTFAKVPSLRILYLDSNYLKFITPKMFSHLTNLKYLHLGNNLLRRVPSKAYMPKSLSIYITKGYSAAALLAILFALPFAWRVLVHREQGHWEQPLSAFYFAHLELFLGNGCLGVGVLMLLALTLERYVSVCHPGHARPILGSPRRAVALIPIITFIFYFPAAFRSKVTMCRLLPDSIVIYQRQELTSLVEHPLYSIYKVLLEFIFKVIPIILLAALNLRILIVYRRSCEKRRRMTLSRTASGEEDPRKFAEERRLVLLLGSTSILFLVCITPMVILNVTLSQNNLTKYPYQVFRAIANLLEITNYSITFYIYCLFSEDFRNTLLRTLRLSGGTPARGIVKPPPPTATTTITHPRSV